MTVHCWRGDPRYCCCTFSSCPGLYPLEGSNLCPPNLEKGTLPRTELCHSKIHRLIFWPSVPDTGLCSEIGPLGKTWRYNEMVRMALFTSNWYSHKKIFGDRSGSDVCPQRKANVRTRPDSSTHMPRREAQERNEPGWHSHVRIATSRWWDAPVPPIQSGLFCDSRTSRLVQVPKSQTELSDLAFPSLVLLFW